MALAPVTDPALLAQLNGAQTPVPVTDPALLAQLNAPDVERTPGGLYHFLSPEGQETFSKSPPPTGSKPYVAPDAATGNSDTGNYFAGWGKSAIDAWRAAQQIPESLDFAGNLAEAIHPSGAPNPLQQEIDESKVTDAPLMRTKAGIAGNISGNVAMMGPFAAEGLPAAAAMGAFQGALQPVATGDPSRAANMAEGAAFGAGGTVLSRILPRVAQPIANNLSPEEAKAVKILADAGIPLTTAERTGSTFLQRLSSSLADNPLTAGRVAGIKASQSSAFNRAALATIGSDADAATQPVMAAAKARIGGVFEDVAARNPVHVDTELASGLQSVLADARASMTDAQFAVVQNHVTNIINAAARNDGSIAGDAFQKLYSGLGKVTSSPEYGTAARDLREVLQSGLERSAQNPADVEALKTARTQYQAMKQLEGAIAADGSGNISVQKLSNALTTKANRSQSIYGTGNQDLISLAQAGRMILPDALANSGTPARLEAGAAPGVIANAGIDLLSGEPIKAAKTAAFGVAPKLGAALALDTGGAGKYLSAGVQDKLTRMLLQNANTQGGRALLQRGSQPLLNSLQPAYGAQQ